MKSEGAFLTVLKDIPRDIHSGFNEDIRLQLRESQYICLPCDTIPGQRIFVYRYLTDDFLSLVRNGIPVRARKQVLKATLQGVGRVVFGRDEDFRYHEEQGALPAFIRLQRQISYFGDTEGLDGLMMHVGDEEINCQILSMLWEERTEDHIPCKPFSDWPDAGDDVFKDLVGALMNLDPKQRSTARQALEHAWFADV